MPLPLRVLRLGGRVVIAALALTVLGLFAVQFEGIVAKNIAIAAQLRAASDDVRSLVAREAVQRRTIARLRDPRGALPEIHAKLHLVGPDQAVIFLRGGEPTPAAVRQWDESQ